MTWTPESEPVTDRRREQRRADESADRQRCFTGAGGHRCRRRCRGMPDSVDNGGRISRPGSLVVVSVSRTRGPIAMHRCPSAAQAARELLCSSRDQINVAVFNCSPSLTRRADLLNVAETIRSAFSTAPARLFQGRTPVIGLPSHRDVNDLSRTCNIVSWWPDLRLIR